MKIAFISVRGIPNTYGGFEQFAEYISVGLVKRGHDVTVYSPHYHPYKEAEYKGVHIRHVYSPEQWMGSSIGSFFYDYACLKDALTRGKYDIIYEAGYTSIIPAYIRFNVKKIKSPVFVTNMDGLEYRRTKFNKLVRKFVLWEEKMAVRHSHYLIADNMGIYDYYKETYGKESKYLAYGADVCDDYNEVYLKEFDLQAGQYYLLVARLEPENNILMAINGYLLSKENGHRPLVIVGNTNTPHGKELVKKYSKEIYVRFLGGVYDSKKLDSLRHYSFAYFHGHSVGGTNPSLLEAMATGSFIFAHDNIFNRTVLREKAFYYSKDEQITEYLNKMPELIAEYKKEYADNNIRVIKDEYSWKHWIDEHETFFKSLL